MSSKNIFQVDGATFTEVERAEYANITFSGGTIEDAGNDTIYLRVEYANGNEPSTWQVRRDEAIAMIWLLAAALIRDGVPGSGITTICLEAMSLWAEDRLASVDGNEV